MTSELTTQQLDEIDARHKAATPGPWGVYEFGGGTAIDIAADLQDTGCGYRARREICRLEDEPLDNDPTHREWTAEEDWAQVQADSVFVAHAREDVPALIAEVRRLRDRVAELEGPAVHARAALAALCYDLEDPGSNALGALYLITKATTGIEAPRDDAAQALARHDAQVMRRCAEFVRDTYQGEWADDAAATLERDADITERGCPGFEKEYQGVSDAKRRLANCKHCGKPRAVHAAVSSVV
jgi:hypothetical protein